MDEDGYLTITDRKADVIIRGGENISAVEVEEVLLPLSGVAEAAVVAAPTHVAGFKVPRSVEFREELPLNATGKVMKDQLR
ncbi:hypothetical protein ACFY1L_30210 [Streptomyces sp. NPDC001663]|uniref:hypothetical protein n=1 Tax=Streptomyces sp. NPDC001663 TaxID=3364597 RepID=UPI00369CF902